MGNVGGDVQQVDLIDQGLRRLCRSQVVRDGEDPWPSRKAVRSDALLAAADRAAAELTSPKMLFLAAPGPSSPALLYGMLYAVSALPISSQLLDHTSGGCPCSASRSEAACLMSALYSGCCLTPG